jgi:hypothetical protein
MNIFIGGARAIRNLDGLVKQRLLNIAERNHTVIIGDADGVDALTQRFFADMKYRGVVVYASNGRCRNNMGLWAVESVRVDPGVRGFGFFAAKDRAMSSAADFGFMIWNGRSRGTRENIRNLADQGKSTLVYLTVDNTFHRVRTLDDYDEMMNAGRARQMTLL